MPWSEFSALMSGLNNETPLGKIVTIRSERDPDVLKSFTPEQKRIRNEWIRKRSRERIKNNPEAVKQQIENLQRALKAAFK